MHSKPTISPDLISFQRESDPHKLEVLARKLGLAALNRWLETLPELEAVKQHQKVGAAFGIYSM